MKGEHAVATSADVFLQVTLGEAREGADVNNIGGGVCLARHTLLSLVVTMMQRSRAVI